MGASALTGRAHVLQCSANGRAGNLADHTRILMHISFGGGGGAVRVTEYLFIDGAYLRFCYEKVMKDFYGSADFRNVDFTHVIRGCDAQKVFYYDCIDDMQKQGENDLDVEKRVKDQEDFFNTIRSQAGYHVILGSMSGTRPKKARQKQVDVHLAVDMMNHAVRRNMDRASLLTGDLDFKPVIEALIDLGIYTRLHYLKRYTAQELVFSADLAREITFQILHGWTKQAFQTAHPIPGGIIGYARDPRTIELRRGTFNGNPLILYGFPHGHPTQDWRCIVAERYTEEGQSLTVLNGDEALLEKYFRTMYGEIQWQ